MRVVLDTEVTRTILDNKRGNPSPYLPTNSLVTVQYHIIDTNETSTLVFNHNEHSAIQSREVDILQDLLNKATLIIGHNLKFDMQWLKHCGFKYNGKLYDTMICDYVFSKGLKRPLSLAECCSRYGLESKSDILEEYWKKGINTNAVPLKELIEYGEQDILITKQLYDKQQELIASGGDYEYMNKSIKLMNDTLPVLISMEMDGIHIDLEELNRVGKQYKEEYIVLETRLKQIVSEVMGHTPINLESPEHLSWVLYSVRVNTKKEWAEIFNLGSEIRNSVVKTKFTRRMSESELIGHIKENTTTLYRTEANQCQACKGAGKITKTKKDNTPFKKATMCKDCDGAGFTYTNTTTRAGFKLRPKDSQLAAQGGFSSDKATLQKVLESDKISPLCREFITALLRINAISTYLGTFVEGIKRNVRGELLHTSYNQCVTATGRLSSSNPNFQNLPRAKTFPIRRVIKSRFKNGKILSVDFKQLEFRVAAILSGDKQAEEDILNNVDIHVFTRDTITAAGQPMDRQDAKIRTFKPLYGGIKGTPAEEAYYKAFLKKYYGIDDWQHRLENEALNTGQIKSPSGRIYSFPFVRRMPNGTVRGHTQIKNYIVQGFATGDLSPLAMIDIYEKLKGLKSKLILVVHDDCTLDVHPDEIDICKNIVNEVFSNMNKNMEAVFQVHTIIPIEGDYSIGDNWLDKVEFKYAA